jgi:myo-inositol-1(or 4)-monophosphatase
MDNLEQLTADVSALAKEVGAYIAEQRKTFTWSKAEIKGQNDLVSYVDKTAEQMITKRLAELMPEAGFITEEQTVAQSAATYRWIVDPLDGTTNFIHGIPAYAVSIALAKDNVVILGVVYEVTRDECFTAWADGGAYLNGEPIQVSTIDRLQDSLILTGLPIQAFDRKMEYLSIVGELMTQTHGLRRIGSAAVDLAYVACGRGEVYFERNINAWDVAAGVLLVQEAGGKVTDFSGGDNYLFGREVVAGGAVHTQLIEVIQKFWN